MAPPGRRKSSLHTFLPLLVLLFISTTAQAASAVLGIDFGTEYIKAAIAKPGSPIDIVLTKDSKRKEAATLAFKPSRAQSNDPNAFPERLYGGDAIAISARYPGDVYPNLKSLLGLHVDEQPVSEYKSRQPGLQVVEIPREGAASGSVGFMSANYGKAEPFMVEELLAMEFQNIKANAEAAVGQNSFVSDAVITYPIFYTSEEKKALGMAAELAGLNVLGLMSDGLAVGLNYATTRKFDSVNDGAKPEYHLVYDMGAGSTTVSVLRFQGKTIKGAGKRNQTVQEVVVLGAGSDRVLGGDALNDLIVRDMLNQFVESPKIKRFHLEPETIRNDGKTMARLRKDAVRVRQVLSANTQSSASFEGLYYEDVSFKYTLTRDHFERLAKAYASRITLPLTEALDQAGLTMGDLTSVILFGGMTRTPFVQKQLEAAVGGPDKIKTNVNADEAAAFGAAFKAAGINPSFRVKDIRTADISGAAVSLQWAADGKSKQQKLFLETSQTGVEKQVNVRATDDIRLTFVRSVTGAEEVGAISAVDVTNLTKSAQQLHEKYGCAAVNMSTMFTVRLNPSNSLPEVVSGSISCKAEKVVGSVMDNVKGLFGFGSKKSDQEVLKEGDEAGVVADAATEQTPLPVDDPTSSGTIVSEATPTEKSISKAATASAVPTPSTIIIPLALTASDLGRNAVPTTAMPQVRQRLADFDGSDRDAVLRSEALNVLEAFTYRARDYLEDASFAKFSTAALQTELGEKLSAVSDWLYGDGMDAKLQDFQDRLKTLKSFVDPVLRRQQEASKRESAVENVRQSLSSASSIIGMIKSSIEKAAADAASQASASASSLAASVASSSSTPSAGTEGDDLDDDPYSSTAEPSSSASDAPTYKPYEYTEEDLSSLSKMYDSVTSWLEEKVTLQDKLSPIDDPAVLVSELEAKTRQLQGLVSDTIMKKVKMNEPPKSKRSSSSKSKSKTSKRTKTSKTTSVTTSADATSSSVRDEL